MALNLDKHREGLIQGWKEVMDDKCPTNWALFAYDGQSFDLKLVGKGDGGLDEMNEEFNSGKIMYGLCQVRLKEKNIHKTVLINWQGEGAPLSRKGMCANHVGIVKNYFKGIHITMNARTEEDVEPELIEQTARKATCGDAIKMSSSIDEDEAIKPVGSNYKRVNPQQEINSSEKDAFWKQEEAAEERRRRDEQNKMRRFSQQEVKLLRRESEEYFASTEKTDNAARNGHSHEAITNGTSMNVNGANGTWNERKSEVIKASKQSSASSGALVRQRIKSFDHGTSAIPLPKQINGIPTSNKASSTAATVRSMTTNFESHSNSSQSSAPINSSKVENCDSEASKSVSVSQRKAMFEGRGTSRAQSVDSSSMPAYRVNNSSIRSNVASFIKAPTFQSIDNNKRNGSTDVNTDDVSAKETPTNMVNHQKEDCSKSSDNDRDTNTVIKSPPPDVVPNGDFTSKSTNGFHEPEEENEKTEAGIKDGLYENQRNIVRDHESSKNGLVAEAPPGFRDDEAALNAASGSVATEEDDEQTIVIEITPEMGLCARAMYDYQAADNTEITFDPGELITNIEKIDAGWWQGLDPKGSYGLFPANYVELLNDYAME